MPTKICTACNIEKSIEEFHRVEKGSEKRRAQCVECKSSKWKTYYSNEENKIHHLKTKKSYREKTRNSETHIIMRLIDQSKKRAKEKGFQHTITQTDIQLPKHCPVLGLKLVANKGEVSSNSYSLDRVRSDGGYTPDNIQVLSFRANSLKGDGTCEEHLKIASYINKEENPFKRLVNAFKAFILML